MPRKRPSNPFVFGLVARDSIHARPLALGEVTRRANCRSTAEYRLRRTLSRRFPCIQEWEVVPL